MFTASDIIHTHTRADLLEDGDLVDVSALAQEAGFRVSVAVTRAVWADCVAWSEEDTKRKHVPQDEQGRLWNVLFMRATSPPVAVTPTACRSPCTGCPVRAEATRPAL